MKTFMAPTKPDIEIGTVSFKSKLDEIIKNYKQKWPVYDFPFELWTEEDEKEKEKKEKGDDADDDDDNKSRDGQHSDVDGPAAASKDVKSTDVNANVDSTKETFHDAIDYAGAPFRNQNNNSGVKEPLLGGDISIEMKAFEANNVNIPFADQKIPAEEFTLQPMDEKADDKNETEAVKYDVDILVFLPDAAKRSTDKWLAEWSDLDSYDEGDDDNDRESVHSYLQRKRASKASNNLKLQNKRDIV